MYKRQAFIISFILWRSLFKQRRQTGCKGSPVSYTHLDVYKRQKVVNKTSEEIEKDLITRCGGNGSIVDICEYSYSELLNAAEKIDNYLLSKKNADNPFEFYGFSICDTDNNIEVYLGDISESNIQDFKKEVLEEPFLKFVKSEKPAFLSEILTGQSIVSGTRSYLSLIHI